MRAGNVKIWKVFICYRKIWIKLKTLAGNVKLTFTGGKDFKKHFKYDNSKLFLNVNIMSHKNWSFEYEKCQKNLFKSETSSSNWSNYIFHYLRYSYLWLRLMRLRLLKWRLCHHQGEHQFPLKFLVGDPAKKFWNWH